MTLRVLHTSDWHLGRMLHGRQRHEEFAAFLLWLHKTAVAEEADILLVAGDIFDTTTPGSRTQQLYYDFLCQMAASSCRHLIITAGNHDSPSLLSAPKELLRVLDIHVIAAAQSPADQVLLLHDQTGKAEAIVCAVPFLRDRDLRSSRPGQSQDEREHELAEGIRRHYAAVCAAAEALRHSLPEPVPVIGMGHLFAAGGRVLDDDGSRSLYVGSLARVGAEAFPAVLDYVALGHLHAAQQVNGSEIHRYSGAPLVMGFAEADRRKSICLIDFTRQDPPQVRTLPVPVFQPLKSIQGDWPQLAAALAALRAEQRSLWLEIIYQGEEVISDLRERLDEAVAGSKLELLRIRNLRMIEQSLRPETAGESLAELGHEQVFHRCLEEHEVLAAQRPELLTAYREIMDSLHQDDPLAGQ